MSDAYSCSSDEEGGYSNKLRSKRQKTQNTQQVMNVEVHNSEPVIKWLSPEMTQEQAEKLGTNLDFDMYGVEWESLSAAQVCKLDADISQKAQFHKISAEDIPYPVKAMYEQALVSFEDDPQDDMMIHTGSFAKVTSEDLRPDGDHYFWICKITAMFVDIKDQKWYFCEWYYLDVDTPLSILDDQGYKINPGKNNNNFEEQNNSSNEDLVMGNRIWKADDSEQFYCSQKFSTIEKLVQVYHIQAGAPFRRDLMNQQDVYWCDQKTSQQFWTYQDLKPSTTKHETRVLQVLDLFCGCGGTSFLEFGSTDKVKIKSLWAVDEKISMANTYQLNNPDVQVYSLKVQELYSVCDKIITWEKAFKNRGFDIQRSRTTTSTHLPLKFGDYQQIQKVSIRLKPEYYVRRSMVDSDNLEFRPSSDEVIMDFLVQIQDKQTWMSDCLLASQFPNLFAQWLRVQKTVPVADEVDVIVGGPPCQGISGLNRHVSYDMNTLLKGSRNGMLLWYYRFVKLFMPSFVLMEQVQSVFVKNQGLYIKTIQWQLLQLRYQSRIGICCAAGYGCPQTRPRVFLWAAKPGEQLPPFPEPIHHMQKPISLVQRSCDVQFQSEEAEKRAYPPVVMGDILMDLPPNCNFASADIGCVKPLGADSSAYLFWIRRKRQNYGGIDRIVARGIDRLAIDMDLDENIYTKIVGLGSSYIRDVNKKYKDTIYSQIFEAQDRAEQEEALQNIIIEIGQKVVEGLHANRELLKKIKRDRENKSDDMDLWVSDLRCVPLNYEDYMRAKNIPKGAGACFLHLPGVHTNKETRRSCCGHFHVCHIDPDAVIVTRAVKERLPDVTYAEPISQVLHLEGCPSKTALIPGTLTPLAVEAHFRIKNGRARTYGEPCSDPFAFNPHGARAPFTRIWWGDAITTVFATPNAAQGLSFHPVEDRFLSPREVARAQGFPDYYVFDWDPALNPLQNLDFCTQVGSQRISTKHIQIGNAVSPVMALHLGRCLAMAAAGDVPPDTSVVQVKGTVYDQAIEEGYQKGLSFYFEKGVRSGYGPSIQFAEKFNINVRPSNN